MSRNAQKRTFWYVRQMKTQVSLRIHAVMISAIVIRM